MDVRIRGIDAEDRPAVYEVGRVVFGGGVPSDAMSAAEASILPFDRVLAAEADSDGIVATTASYLFDLTMPGGGTLPAAGITNVGVLPTHRRRGILRALVESQLETVAEAGEPLAILNASEAGIYGRYGFGLASRYAVWRIRPRRATFAVAAPHRRLRLLRGADAIGTLRELYEAARPIRPGTVSRNLAWWEMLLGPTEMWKGGGHFEVVLAEPEGDDPGGYAIYRLSESPQESGFVLGVRELVAASADTQAALWRFLLDVDLVSVVTAEAAVDDPLPWRLTDYRAVGVTELRDFLFVRVLDAPTALAGRRYSAEIDIVFELADALRPNGAASGRFRLRGGPDGATCEQTGATADVAIDVAELGSLVLGGVRARWLAAAGRLAEQRPGAVAELDRAFPWSPEPFCATRF